MPTPIAPPRRSSPPEAPGSLVPTRLVGRVCSYLRAGGIDPGPLIERHRLPRTLEADPFVLVTAEVLRSFLEGAEELSGDPFLGLHAAEVAGHDALGTLVFACSGCDGRTALDRYVRYFGSFHADLTATVDHREEGSLLKVTLPGAPDCLGRSWNEHWAASVTLAARGLAEARFAPQSVCLAHADDRSRSELTRILGTGCIQFGQGYNALMFGRHDRARTLRNDGAPIDALLGRFALSAPIAASGFSGLRGRLREVMAGALPEGEPTVGQVARSLGMSARTLQRRLSASALTFQQVLDELRRDLALPRVQRGELSLDAIAAELGYSQVSAFFRAFRRWTGATPRALRSSGSRRDRGDAAP